MGVWTASVMGPVGYDQHDPCDWTGQGSPERGQ